MLSGDARLLSALSSAPLSTPLARATLKSLASCPGPFSLSASRKLLDYLLSVEDRDKMMRKIFMYPTKEVRWEAKRRVREGRARSSDPVASNRADTMLLPSPRPPFWLPAQLSLGRLIFTSVLQHALSSGDEVVAYSALELFKGLFKEDKSALNTETMLNISNRIGKRVEEVLGEVWKAFGGDIGEWLREQEYLPKDMR